jgi:hypothetical protein
MHKVSKANDDIDIPNLTINMIRRHNMRHKKSQTAVEFVILTGVMIMVFLIVYILVQQKIITATENRNDAAAQQIIDLLINEIKVAQSVSDGYTRYFNMPTYLNNLEYTISIIPGLPGTTEIVIKYYDKEKVYFLEESVNKTSTVSVGLNKITKKSGDIMISPVP